MKGRLTAVTALAATLALAYALVVHHPAARVVEAASPVMAMTASEHIAHLAQAGDPHAQHALMEAAWAPLQAAPSAIAAIR